MYIFIFLVAGIFDFRFIDSIIALYSHQMLVFLLLRIALTAQFDLQKHNYIKTISFDVRSLLVWIPIDLLGYRLFKKYHMNTTHSKGRCHIYVY